MSETGTFVIHDLVLPIAEAHETLCAIRKGEVDALVVATDGRQRVYILKGADQAHRILLETLNEGAATIAADATVLYANRRLAELLDRPLERVLGAPLTRFVDPDDAGRFAALLAEAVRGRSKGEIHLVSAGGHPVPVMLSMSALGEGQDESYTVVVTDLTQLKQAQTALQRANDELEARVEARTRELSEANEALLAEIAQRTRLEDELRAHTAALLEADQRKDEFLSMLAHELRNPLAPILTAAEMIRMAMGARSDLPDLERYRGVIARQVKNLAHLVDDLLDVSRITRGSITLRRGPVELAAVVRSAVEAARPAIDQHHHHLRVALPGEPVWLLADATRCEQVLVNLLNNAAKFTERGGNISLSAALRGAEVVLSVRDDGAGIPPDLLPRVFDLFVQGECSLDRAQGGLGIGLTLVKRLVEMHGGTVEARSEGAGHGSEMVIRLPLAVEARSATASADPEEPSARAAPHRGAACSSWTTTPTLPRCSPIWWSLWGHVVARASNGEDALRMATTFHPDIVLMDIGLPGMDGYEVARRLRLGHRPAPEWSGPRPRRDHRLWAGARSLARARDRLRPLPHQASESGHAPATPGGRRRRARPPAGAMTPHDDAVPPDRGLTGQDLPTSSSPHHGSPSPSPRLPAVRASPRGAPHGEGEPRDRRVVRRVPRPLARHRDGEPRRGGAAPGRALPRRGGGPPRRRAAGQGRGGPLPRVLADDGEDDGRRGAHRARHLLRARHVVRQERAPAGRRGFSARAATGTKGAAGAAPPEPEPPPEHTTGAPPAASQGAVRERAERDGRAGRVNQAALDFARDPMARYRPATNEFDLAFAEVTALIELVDD